MHKHARNNTNTATLYSASRCKTSVFNAEMRNVAFCLIRAFREMLIVS